MNGPLSREITRRGWLGVAALEDKVVQREVVEALNALRARSGARLRQGIAFHLRGQTLAFAVGNSFGVAAPIPP
jgi:hypothetical protein